MAGPSLPDAYESLYEKASVLPQQLDDEETAFLASLTPSAGGMHVLDVGCAEGALAVQLARMGHEVTAADISRSHVARTRQRAGDDSLTIEAVQCNIEADLSALEGKTFDLIFFLNVVEHLKSPVAGLVNVRKLLKDQGVLWIQTPNACRLSRLLRQAVHRRPFADLYNPKNLKDLHLQVYDYLAIEQALNFVGLEVTSIVPTRLTLPVLGRFRVFGPVFRLLAKLCPLLSDQLLLSCKRARPIDVEEQIEFWARTRGIGDG